MHVMLEVNNLPLQWQNLEMWLEVYSYENIL